MIDFINTDREVLKLLSDHFANLYVPSSVVEEVDGIVGEKELSKTGLKLIEPEIEDAYAARSNSGPLSFQDWLCLLTAKRHGFTCVTNDKKLRQICEKEGVKTLWGLELLIMLHQGGGITAERAMMTALEIRKSNPKHITSVILDRFKNRINDS